MPRKIKPPTFDEAINKLRSLQFDVSEAAGVANRPPGAAVVVTPTVMVTKYGCAAVLGRSSKGGVVLAERPGVLLGGEIALLLDRGYQKFLKTSRLEIAATADRLQAEHRFIEELDDATGAVSLYNEALGSVSDEYMYDRLKGRDQDAPARGLTPWDVAAGVTGDH